MKYLIYEGSLAPYEVHFFDKIQSHFEVHNRLYNPEYSNKRPISAGKVQFGNFLDGKNVSLIPGSSTLKIEWSKERQEEDNRIIEMVTRNS